MSHLGSSGLVGGVSFRGGSRELGTWGTVLPELVRRGAGAGELD